MATLKQRHHKFEARVRIPAAMQDQYEGRSHLYRTLAASDRRAAKLEADAWELSLRADWATREGGSSASLRQVYDTFRQIAEREELTVHGDPHSFDEVTAGLELELERMADQVGRAELSAEQQGKVWALKDAVAEREGREVHRRPELEPSFYELSCDYLAQWERKPGLKETNTGQQKRATFDLFSSFINEKAIRTVSPAKGSEFVDALRRLDPNWARTGKARSEQDRLDWRTVQRQITIARRVHDLDRAIEREVALMADISGYDTSIDPVTGEATHTPRFRHSAAARDRASRMLRDLEHERAQFMKEDGNPDVNRLTIGLLAVINEDERERISERTKAALAAAKARGVKLGNPNGAQAFRRAGKGNADSVAAIQTNADRFAESLRDIVEAILRDGITSLAGIASELDARHIRTARGGRWHPSSVKNLLHRLIL